MGCRNPVGESPTSCALVLFEKFNLMHQRKAVCEGDAVFESGRNEVSYLALKRNFKCLRETDIYA